jgi:hypothetical protein
VGLFYCFLAIVRFGKKMFAGFLGHRNIATPLVFLTIERPELDRLQTNAASSI